MNLKLYLWWYRCCISDISLPPNCTTGDPTSPLLFYFSLIYFLITYIMGKVGYEGCTPNEVEKEVAPLTHTNEAFYRRFTLPEERRNRVEWGGGYRWFLSPNVVKLEDHRPSGELGRILERLRQHKRDQAAAAVVNILMKAKCRPGGSSARAARPFVLMSSGAVALASLRSRSSAAPLWLRSIDCSRMKSPHAAACAWSHRRWRS